jgi:hypothetical protein
MPLQKTKELYTAIPMYVKAGISAILIIGSLIGAVIKVEDRYVDQEEITQSLSQFDNKIQQDLVRIDLRILNMQYDQYTEHYYAVKQELRAAPDDVELLVELEEYKTLREKTKEEINAIIK